MLEGALLDSMGCAYGTMAHQATDEGQHEHASELLERSMDCARQAMGLAREAGHGHNEATARANLAEGLVQMGRPEGALALMEASGIDAACHLPSVASHHFDTHGSILMALGRNADAIRLFEQAFQAAKAIHLSLVACEHLAEARERLGDFKAALLHHRRFHTFTSSRLRRRRSAVPALPRSTSRPGRPWHWQTGTATSRKTFGVPTIS